MGAVKPERGQGGRATHFASLPGSELATSGFCASLIASWSLHKAYCFIGKHMTLCALHINISSGCSLT